MTFVQFVVYRIPRGDCYDERIGLLVNHLLLDVDHTWIGQHIRRIGGDGDRFV